MANVTDLFNFKEKMKDQRDENGTKYVEIIVPLKRISNFWRTLEMAVINYKINFFLTSSANYVIVSTTVINRSKRKSKATIHAQNQYLDYLINSSFQGVNSYAK